jgi:hypothetical protein
LPITPLLIKRLPVVRLSIVRWVAAVAVGAAACAPAPRIAFPAGALIPAPEAVTIWQQTTDACRAAANYGAEIVINGRLAGEKLRSVRLHSGFTRDGRIRLEAVAPIGAPIFVLAGRAERATLTLPHDHRVLVAPVDDIVNALIGLKFTPADWVDVLSGCVGVSDPARASGGRAGADIVISHGANWRALLRKLGADWRVIAGERAEALIEYRSYLGTWPSLARITSTPSAAVPLSINLEITQIFANSTLSDKTFTLDVPPGFEPMTLAELRAIGPLGEKEQ